MYGIYFAWAGRAPESGPPGHSSGSVLDIISTITYTVDSSDYIFFYTKASLIWAKQQYLWAYCIIICINCYMLTFDLRVGVSPYKEFICCLSISSGWKRKNNKIYFILRFIISYVIYFQNVLIFTFFLPLTFNISKMPPNLADHLPDS